MLRFIADGTERAEAGRNGIDSCLACIDINLEAETSVGWEIRGRSEAMPAPRSGAARAAIVIAVLDEEAGQSDLG